MKIKQALINKYNTSESLLVVSSYPEKGQVYSAKVGGIASFCKNTVSNLPRQVVVIGEYFDKPQIYEEGNALVLKVFQKNSLLMWIKILNALRQFNLIKKVLIQFDFALYGNILTSSLIVPFLGVLKILGFETNIVVHSVVTDVFNLSGHLGLKSTFFDRIKGFLLNKAFRFFYFSLGILTNKIITTEQALKERLKKYINNGKLITIPHGVDTSLKPIDKNLARKKLKLDKNERIILFFGFVNWFKGADIFADTYHQVLRFLGKNARFILAGGQSATLKKQAYYQEYFSQVLDKINTSQKIEITGFVPQEKIKLYFSAADLVVFPYRSFICASGPMSFVFSYQKPFIVSEKLIEMFSSPDFENSLREAGLNKQEISFALNKKAMLEKTSEVLKNGVKVKMIRLAQIMKQKRDWQKTALLYESLVFAPSLVYKKELALSYAQ